MTHFTLAEDWTGFSGTLIKAEIIAYRQIMTATVADRTMTALLESSGRDSSCRASAKGNGDPIHIGVIHIIIAGTTPIP